MKTKLSYDFLTKEQAQKREIELLRYEQLKIKARNMIKLGYYCAYISCSECPFKKEYGKCVTGF